MNSTQCKMARAGLGWSVKKLGEAANVTPNTVSRYENGKDSYISTSDKLQKALESSLRVRFEGEDGVFIVGSE